MATRIYTTLAPSISVYDGCIERASTVKQDTRREGTGQGRCRARVAWRILGDDSNGKWMISCRTPRYLRGGLAAGEVIGDGSDEAVVAWLLDDKKGGG